MLSGPFFKRSQKSKPQLVYQGFVYNKKISYGNGNTNWRCSDFLKHKCFATCITKGDNVIRRRSDHKHPPQMTKFDKTKLYTSVYELSLHENIIDGPQ